MRNYTLFLHDIIEAMEAIESFVKEMTFQEFEDDDRTASAVLKKLEIIGEAVKNLPDVVIEKYSDIPWDKMAGLRDRLVHAYWGTDYTIIWEAAKDIIPGIKPRFQKIYSEEKK
jgi:uncharacterized protein with HEPN domain